MDERIELLGIEVDVASTKIASDKTIAFMAEEGSRTVYFLNSESLLLLQTNDNWNRVMAECGLVLPGSVNVNTSINDVLGHKRDPFFVESYLDVILDYAVETGLEFLLVTESEEQFISVQENIHEKRPFLTLSGFFRKQQDESLEHIVNEINSVAPDILMLALSEEDQMRLLESYRTQMNAGLMLFTGDMLYNKAVAEAEVPERISRLKIDNLYKWFQMGGRVKAFFNNVRMKVRLKVHQKGKEN